LKWMITGGQTVLSSSIQRGGALVSWCHFAMSALHQSHHLGLARRTRSRRTHHTAAVRESPPASGPARAGQRFSREARPTPPVAVISSSRSPISVTRGWTTSLCGSRSRLCMVGTALPRQAMISFWSAYSWSSLATMRAGILRRLLIRHSSSGGRPTARRSARG